MIRNFKLIVAGGRDFNDRDLAYKLLDIVKRNLDEKEVKFIIISGMARGADMIGYDYAISRMVQVLEYPAQWDKYGKGAGYKRNSEMGQVADSALIFWNGKSKGTKNMIDVMIKLGKPFKVIKY